MIPSEWLERAARLHPGAPALYEGTRLVSDYAAFARSAARIGAGLRTRYAVEPGDRVALFLGNGTAYLELLYGIWYAGGVAVPINAKLHPREVGWMIADCGAKVVFCEDDAGDLAACVDPARVALLGPCDTALRAAAPLNAPVARGAQDLAWIFYTSGTTGQPKGVMLSNANLLAMTQSYFIDVDAVTADDCALYAAPMSHGAGLYNFVFVMRAARHVVPPSGGFDAAEVATMAGVHGNICMFAAPTMVRRMISDAARSGYDGAGIKTIVYGGGPMYLADILEAVERFGPRLVQIYGQGESPMTITALSRDLVADRTHPRWRARLASVGTAQSAVRVMIADEAGRQVAPGTLGEILVAGPPVMQGYWGNAPATQAALRGGWLWTGDLGTMDEDGFVMLSDRSKDLIISGGTNISPREVEEALASHPSVYQVSVVGRPDPEWGEVVVAFIVLAPDAAPDPDALDAYCLTRIARFKRPKQYEFLDALPQNSYGKVLKTELRARLAQG